MKKTRTMLSALLFALFLGVAPQLYGEEGRVAEKAEDTEPIKKGVMLPEAQVQTIEGERVSLSSQVGAQPSVLVFYRGGWCPYCTTQLKALVELRAELDALGFQLIALSPDRPEMLKESLGELELDYTLLSDAEAHAAKALGIAFQVDEETITLYKGYGIDLEEASGESHHILPVPTVLLTDKNGVVRYVFSEADYKVRLSNEDLLKAAKKASK